MKRFLILVIAMHIILVISDMVMYDYQQKFDSPRYIYVANEFSSLNFSNLDAAMNCNTSPGYPIFLAIIKFLTFHNKFLIAIIQSVLFCYALYFFLNILCQKGYLNSSLLKLTYVLVLFSPEIFETNSWTLTESLCASLMLFMLGSFFTDLKTKFSIILFTISATFLVLTKSEYSLVLLFILFVLAIKKNWKPLILTISVLSVSLTLNGYRNFLIMGKFNPTSFGAGTVMYGGNNKNGDGSWHMHNVTHNYLPAGEMEKLRVISELPDSCECIKKDSLFKKLAIQSWKENGVLFQLKIIPVKLGKLWLIPAQMDFYTGQTEIKKGLQIMSLFDDSIWPWYGKYKHGFYISIYWSYLLLAFFGFIYSIKKNGIKEYDYIVIALCIILSLMYGIFFYGLGRFHVPVFPLFIIYSSITVKYLDRKFFQGIILNYLNGYHKR
jgi:hypothetical protein